MKDDLKKLVLSREVGTMWDTKEGFTGTEIKTLKITNGMIDRELRKVYFANTVRFWSRALRIVVENVRPLIDDYISTYGEEDFDTKFEDYLSHEIDDKGLKENYNFSRQLFTDDSFIKSSIYRNNKNHNIVIYHSDANNVDKCICAVYIGEVLWVISTLARILDIEIEILYTGPIKIKQLDGQITIEEYMKYKNDVKELLTIKLDGILRQTEELRQEIDSL